MLKHPTIPPPNYPEAFDFHHPQPDIPEVHEHDDHREHDAPISKKWKWATVLGNLAVGVAEMATGRLDSMSLAGDAVHNMGDVASYAIQADNILKREELSEEKIKKRRKMSYMIICLGSAAVAAKASVDLFTRNTEAHSATIGAAGASLALTSALYYKLEKGIRKHNKRHRIKKRTHTQRDLTKHMWAVDIPSAAIAVSGAVTHNFVNSTTEQVLGVASGIMGAVAFRFTKKNLDHDHSHDFTQDDEHHHEHNESERKLRWYEKLSSHIWATGSYAAGRIKNWVEKPGFEHKKSRPMFRKIALGVTAVAGVAASHWLGQELFSNEVIDAGTAHLQPPVAAPSAPVAPVFEQHTAMLPESTSAYSETARTVTPGEGFEHMIKRDMGLNYSQEVLEKSGEALSNMEYADGTSISYFNKIADEWRLHLPSAGEIMPEVALDAVRAEALALAK